MCRARRPLLTPKWLRYVTGDTFDCALFTAVPGALLEADIILLANREPRQRGSHLTLGKWIRTFGPFRSMGGWVAPPNVKTSGREIEGRSLETKASLARNRRFESISLQR